MFDSHSTADAFLSAPMKKLCSDSFWVRAQERSLCIDNKEYKAKADDIPLHWLLGEVPVINGKQIEVLQIMQIKRGIIAEVRYIKEKEQ